MEEKNSFRQNKISDLGKLSQVAGGADAGTEGLSSTEQSILIATLRNGKRQGYTLEQVIDTVLRNCSDPGKKAPYEAFTRKEWANW